MKKGDMEMVTVTVVMVIVLVIGLLILISSVNQSDEETIDCVAVCEQELITEEPNISGCDCSDFGG